MLPNSTKSPIQEAAKEMTAGEVGHRLSELQKESDAASEVVMEKFLLSCARC